MSSCWLHLFQVCWWRCRWIQVSDLLSRLSRLTVFLFHRIPTSHWISPDTHQISYRYANCRYNRLYNLQNLWWRPCKRSKSIRDKHQIHLVHPDFVVQSINPYESFNNYEIPLQTCGMYFTLRTNIIKLLHVSSVFYSLYPDVTRLVHTLHKGN